MAAFLTGEIGFLEIEALVAHALEVVAPVSLDSFETVVAADAAARAAVASRLAEARA